MICAWRRTTSKCRTATTNCLIWTIGSATASTCPLPQSFCIFSPDCCASTMQHATAAFGRRQQRRHSGNICVHTWRVNYYSLLFILSPTAIESESSHEAHMAKRSDTEIPAYLVRQTRTPSVFTMDSPEGRQKMLGFGKEARHIFHGPAPRSLSQRSMSVDFVSMNMNRRRKASFPTDLTQITEELGEVHFESKLLLIMSIQTKSIEDGSAIEPTSPTGLFLTTLQRRTRRWPSSWRTLW